MSTPTLACAAPRGGSKSTDGIDRDEGGSSIVRRRRKVVVASSDGARAAFVALALRRRGLEVVCAPTGRAAREAIRDTLPALVVVHLPLPDESGIGLLTMSRREIGARTIALVEAGLTVDSPDVDVRLPATEHVMAVVNAARDLVGFPDVGGDGGGDDPSGGDGV